MKRVNLPLLILLLLIPSTALSQYRIANGTFNGGGGVRSGDHMIYDSAAQAAAALMTGASNEMKLGFWYIADLTSTVDVAISSFQGRYRDDIVFLEWTVKADSPFDGYNLFRSEEDEEDFTRLNERLITADETVRFSDDSAVPGRDYRYYISAVSDGVERVRSTTITLSLPPKPVTLYQNYPNPFNPSTTIAFFLPEKAAVKLDIFDVKGRKVMTLVDGLKEAGKHRIEWNGNNGRRKPVSSGIYYYRLSAGKDRITRKLVLMR